jgi:hypothetical protein
MASDRFCRLYTTGQAAGSAGNVIERLSILGFRLEFPGTLNVTEITEAGQRCSSRTKLLERLRSETDVHLQLWKSESWDVYCRVRQILGGTSIDLGMDGWRRAEIDSFVGGVLHIAAELAREGVLIGFLYDSDGGSMEDDWDSFFLKDNRAPQMPPDILYVKADIATTISKQLHAVSQEKVNGFVLLRF